MAEADGDPNIALLKICKTVDGEETQFLALGRTSWLSDENGSFETLWPPVDPTFEEMRVLLRKVEEPPSDWIKLKCDIIKTYSKYIDAHLGLKHRLEDSDYHTEVNLGKGQRRKRPSRKVLSNDEDDDVAMVVPRKRPSFNFDGGSQVDVRNVATEKKKFSRPNIIRKLDRGTAATNIDELKEILNKTLEKKNSISTSSASKEVSKVSVTMQGEKSTEAVIGERQKNIDLPTDVLQSKLIKNQSTNLIVEERNISTKASTSKEGVNNNEFKKVLVRNNESTKKLIDIGKTTRTEVNKRGVNIQKKNEAIQEEVSRKFSLSNKTSSTFGTDTCYNDEEPGNNESEHSWHVRDSESEVSEISNSEPPSDLESESSDSDSGKSNRDSYCESSVQQEVESDTNISSSQFEDEGNKQNRTISSNNEDSGFTDMHDDVYNNSLTHESPKYSVFERQMLSMIKTLNCKVDTVLMNQSKLNLHLMPGERVIAIPHGMPSIPLKSEDELRSMEKYLDVGDNVTSLSMLLSCYVSKDERLEYKSTLKLLPNLICNNVAKSFSLAGQRGKGAFNKLKVYTAMRAAMLCKLPQSDLLEMERACKVWLRDAAYRVQGDGGTSKRCKTPKHSKASKEKSKGRSKEKSKK